MKPSEMVRIWLLLEKSDGKHSILRNDDDFFLACSITALERAKVNGKTHFRVQDESGENSFKILFKSLDKKECEDFLNDIQNGSGNHNKIDSTVIKITSIVKAELGGQINEVEATVRKLALQVENLNKKLSKKTETISKNVLTGPPITVALKKNREHSFNYTASLEAMEDNIQLADVALLFILPDGEAIFYPMASMSGPSDIKGMFQLCFSCNGQNMDDFEVIDSILVIRPDKEIQKVECIERFESVRGFHFFGMFGPKGRIIKKENKYYLKDDKNRERLIDITGGRKTYVNKLFEYGTYETLTCCCPC